MLTVLPATLATNTNQFTKHLRAELTYDMHAAIRLRNLLSSLSRPQTQKCLQTKPVLLILKEKLTLKVILALTFSWLEFIL
jgi:hypothetical protein